MANVATDSHPLYCLDELIEKRRNILRYARTFPPGAERNNVGKLRRRCGCYSGTRIGWQTTRTKVDRYAEILMVEGVPFRDRIGLEFKTNAEAIAHCGSLARHFYEDSLSDDQDLEISVVNASGREIRREFVHRR